jgi:hypothetical protein
MVESKGERRKEGSMTNREGKLIMSTWKSVLLAGAMAFAPVHALAAQEAPEAEMVEGAIESDEAEIAARQRARMQREMDEAIAFVEKMFDVGSLPPIEPARLTLAETTTAALVPQGSLEKMMDNLYGKMISSFLNELNGSSAMMISIKTGVDSDQVAALDDKSRAAITDLFDPHRKQREDQIMKIIRPIVSEVLADIEAPMRSGMAKAYARKFDAEQLTAINAFFATPAGQSYANESLALQADPEIMVAVAKALPPMVMKFMDRAPDLEGEMKALPMERQLADLNEAELKKLAKLLKVDVKALREHRDAWNDASETEDAAGETDDWAAYDRSNWSEEDLARIEAAEAAVTEAEQQAIANARAKMPKTPST